MPDRPQPPRSLIDRIDDGIVAAERAIAIALLAAMTVMVFLDVVYRRITAPDSRVATFLIDAVARVGGPPSEATRRLVEHRITPVLLWLLAYVLVSVASRSLRRVPAGTRGLFDWLVIGPAGLFALWGLGWLMEHAPSRWFYLVLYGLGALAFVVDRVRKRPVHFWPPIVGLALATPLVVWAAYRYMPRGYTWAKEVSMICLVWVGFLGASMCAYYGKHLKLEAGERLIPARWKPAIAAASAAVTALFCVFYVAIGYVYVFGRPSGFFFRETAFELTGIPLWVCSVIIPASFAIMAMRFGRAAVRALRPEGPA